MEPISVAEIRADDSTCVRGWPAALLLLALVVFAALAGAGVGYVAGDRAHCSCCCCDCCVPPPPAFYEYPPSVIIEHGPHDWPEPPASCSAEPGLVPPSEIIIELPDVPTAECPPECPKKCPPKNCPPRCRP